MDISLYILLFAHIIGDFYLQTEKIAKCKIGKYSENCENCNKCKEKKGINFGILAIHVAIYCLPFMLLFFNLKWYLVLAYIAIIFATHYIIDVFSCLTKKYSNNQIVIFIIDQCLHLLTLYILYKFWFIKDIYVPTWFIPYETIFVKITLTLILILPCSIFINCIFDSLPSKNNIDNDSINIKENSDITNENRLKNKKEKKKFFQGFADPGMIIGIAERLIVLFLAFAKAYSSIAIIITVKT